MRVKIRLTNKEVEYVNQIAHQRNKKEKRFGGKTYNNKLNSEKAHLIGLAAEFAIAQLFGVQIDDKIYHNHGDSGIDLILSIKGTQVKVAVKATTYQAEPFLRAEVKHNKPEIDIYILCYVNKEDISDVEFVGWQYRQVVEKAKIRKFSQYGPQNYVLTEKELLTFEDIK